MRVRECVCEGGVREGDESGKKRRDLSFDGATIKARVPRCEETKPGSKMRGCWRAIAKHVPCDRPWGTRASRVPMQAAQADSHLELYLSPVVLTAAIDDSELFELLADTTVCRSYGGWVRAETENAIEKYGCDCDGCACGGTSTSAGFCLTAKMYDSDIDGWNNGE